MTEHGSDYLFAGAVRLRVRGPVLALQHFDAEFGEAAVPADGARPDVEVGFRWGTGLQPLPGGPLISDGHKSARWRVSLGSPTQTPLQAELALSGGPRSFGLSLVQGWYVEALVAVALARTGCVALPGAAFAGAGGATVLLGRSGAGKTTLTARALASGRTVLSDDQVLLDPEGCVRRYPRRLRIYPDIEQTAPQAWGRLRPSTRAALRRRRHLRRLTRGLVAPSLAVPAAEIGLTVERTPIAVRHVVVVNRSDDETMTVTPRQPAWVAEQAGLVLTDQRARISRQVDGAWHSALDDALAAERRAVAAALGDVPATELIVPRAWPAGQSVEAIERQLAITPGGATPPAGQCPTPAR